MCASDWPPVVGVRVAGLVFLALMASACSAPAPPVAELKGPTMGTRYSVRLSPAPDDDTLTRLQLRIDERLRMISAQMSTYLKDSDLMRFNRSTSTDWQSVPPELIEMVRRAARVSDRTHGRYDITIGPLVNLWGFGNAGDRDRPPAESEIDDTLSVIGYRKLEWRNEPPALRKRHAGLEIDLSSIAKGWAVDEVGALLGRQGIQDFLVEIGGETLARGTKADGSAWRIAIERPDDARRIVQGGLAVRDLAIATSGDYRNFFEHEGQRFTHTIDPQTGRPIRHRLASVTVLADNCADADAWATAMMALGEVDGPPLADELGLAALFIVRDGDSLREQTTKAFRDLGIWESRY